MTMHLSAYIPNEKKQTKFLQMVWLRQVLYAGDNSKHLSHEGLFVLIIWQLKV